MEIDILTLFPQMFHHSLGDSIIGRAQERGLISIRCHQIRDFTTNRQNQVDDYPYGGGRGCVMLTQPLYDAWLHAKAFGGAARTICFTPRGKVFTQGDARRLARDYQRLIFVCGHYEGMDQRFIDTAVDEEISLGDFVLTGGEIPAMAVADAVCRLVPGVLADESCFTEESHWNGLLEYPHYSRPALWKGQAVPDILLSGNHGVVERWRRKQAFLTTLQYRPDMFEKLLFSKEDLKLLGELREETEDLDVQAALAPIHTGRITVRRTGQRDLNSYVNLYQSKGLSPADAAAYIASLESEGTGHFSIYADDHGFVGHGGYHVEGKKAYLHLELFPHGRGKGIDVYALARMVEDAFALPRVEVCVAPEDVSEDAVRRIGFACEGKAGERVLCKLAWNVKHLP